MSSPTKTVLITGATRGIGLKFVELYVKRGWNVIGAARDLTKAEKLKALSPYKLVQLDASDEASIARAAKELESESIDLLVNNAGVLSPNGLATSTKADLVHQFEINAVGPFLVTRAFVPHLKAAVAARGAASVAQVSSFFGSVEFVLTQDIVSHANFYGYRTSKAALNMINASLALDLKNDGIAAFVLHPGLVATDMTNYAPGTISPDESVEGLITTVSKLSIADTGKFYGYNGEIIPW